MASQAQTDHGPWRFLTVHIVEPLYRGSKKSPAPPAGRVTMLFTDIEGSTRLLRAFGTDYARVLSDQRRIMREAINDNDGHEMGTEGDNFFVAFAFRALRPNPWVSMAGCRTPGSPSTDASAGRCRGASGSLPHAWPPVHEPSSDAASDAR